MSLPPSLLAKLNERVLQAWPIHKYRNAPAPAVYYSGSGLGSPQWAYYGTPISLPRVLQLLTEAGHDISALQAEIDVYLNSPARRVEALQVLEDAETAAKKRVADFKREWVKEKCPHKPGTVMVVGRRAHSFVGKHAEVAHVTVAHNGLNWVWRINGRVITRGEAAQRLSAVPMIAAILYGRTHTAVWDEPIDGLTYDLCSPTSSTSSSPSPSADSTPGSGPLALPTENPDSSSSPTDSS